MVPIRPKSTLANLPALAYSLMRRILRIMTDDGLEPSAGPTRDMNLTFLSCGDKDKVSESLMMYRRNSVTY